MREMTRGMKLGLVGAAMVLASCAVRGNQEPGHDAQAKAHASTPTQTTRTIMDSSAEGAARVVAIEPSSPQARAPFVVHEWGTYTSVQSASGKTLDGMMHEDESLPAFVHARDQDRLFSKGIESIPEWINQKLETPVIYFHGDPGANVSVRVDFPEGVISEWYPAATSFAPEIGSLNKIAGGTMTWDVALLDREPNLVSVPPENIWAPSREVDARAIQVGEEEERFIFYRGLGRFTMPVRTVSEEGDVFTIHNESEHDLPAVFVLNVSSAGGTVTSLGSVRAGESRVAKPTPKEMPLAAYERAAHAALLKALIESGLYEDEARAMVNTWTRSYFRTPGRRVLYVAPESWTRALLPLTVKPVPDEVVRTLVGRIEVMTAREEAELLELIRRSAASEADPGLVLDALGRFADPKLRRMLELLDGDHARGYCAALLRAALVEDLGVFKP